MTPLEGNSFDDRERKIEKRRRCRDPPIQTIRPLRRAIVTNGILVVHRGGEHGSDRRYTYRRSPGVAAVARPACPLISSPGQTAARCEPIRMVGTANPYPAAGAILSLRHDPL